MQDHSRWVAILSNLVLKVGLAVKLKPRGVPSQDPLFQEPQSFQSSCFKSSTVNSFIAQHYHIKYPLLLRYKLGATWQRLVPTRGLTIFPCLFYPCSPCLPGTKPGCVNLAGNPTLVPGRGKGNRSFLCFPSTEMLLAPFRFVKTTAHLRNNLPLA